MYKHTYNVGQNANACMKEPRHCEVHVRSVQPFDSQVLSVSGGAGSLQPHSHSTAIHCSAKVLMAIHKISKHLEHNS